MKLGSTAEDDALHGRPHKYWHYLLIVSALSIAISLLALLNAYLDFNNASTYTGIPSSLLVAGYVGMFLTIFASPIPDYVLVPIYGYLSSIGVFNPFLTFFICMLASVLPIPFFAGKVAGRPLLLKGLSYFHITEKDIEVADGWLLEHGRFSIFTSTFIPFFYTVASLAAGTLKMNTTSFMILSIAGFGIRFVFLEYVGYSSIEIFTASFDFAQRGLIFFVLIVSSVYVAVYLARITLSER
jgi:membrane protein DedA with SNARE-associated domain